MEEDINILIVDDNQENLKVVSNFLKDKGYNIALSLDGPGALKILETDKIDLILLDIMMPGMNGFEVCKKIMENTEWQDIPVIFLTAKTETDDLVEGFNSGGVDYITKPFNKDELLIRVNNHLELADAKKQIIKLNKNRDKLYSIIAHDIRSPFAGIIQTLEAISGGFIDTNSDEFTEIFQLLKQRTLETSALLNNLLEWTKRQGDSITLAPGIVKIYTLLAECVQLLKANAESKNISIKLNVPKEGIAFCDEVTIHTVFRNLISNAIKFTPTDGHIEIGYDVNANYIEISVIDTGIGIPEDIIDKIFTKDEHYTSRGTINEQGSGLGLIMVKDFVNKNKGKLKVESTPGKGTKIVISLPIEE